ncbi:unnamed protein product [Symbiodinium pilosum]|uniref:Uncharacterized protein n=1 Tax=Symbiodinium pilosum TaxID=2952 RepID=A0A812NZQ9_SYMPI|nr:unnamed protein product [Symbiodinium pilosum]
MQWTRGVDTEEVHLNQVIWKMYLALVYVCVVHGMGASIMWKAATRCWRQASYVLLSGLSLQKSVMALCTCGWRRVAFFLQTILRLWTWHPHGCRQNTEHPR